MKMNFCRHIVIIFFFTSCGKNFTPASKKDLEEASNKSAQKTQTAQTCVNENIFISFEPTEETKGQITVASKVVLESTMQNNLASKASRYELEKKQVSNGPHIQGETLKRLKPTVLNRSQSDKLINRAFVKFLCANANSASLVDSSFEKRNPSDKSNNFDFRFDAVQEIWACHGPCNQETLIWN